MPSPLHEAGKTRRQHTTGRRENHRELKHKRHSGIQQRQDKAFLFLNKQSTSCSCCCPSSGLMEFQDAKVPLRVAVLDFSPQRSESLTGPDSQTSAPACSPRGKRPKFYTSPRSASILVSCFRKNRDSPPAWCCSLNTKGLMPLLNHEDCRSVN